MSKLRRLIYWLIPTGLTVNQLRHDRGEYRANGVLNCGRQELQIYKLKPTYWNGVFLVYSIEEYNETINYKINNLKYQIKQLEDKLK